MPSSCFVNLVVWHGPKILLHFLSVLNKTTDLANQHLVLLGVNRKKDSVSFKPNRVDGIVLF